MSYLTTLLFLSCCMPGAHAGWMTADGARDSFTSELAGYSRALADIPHGGPQCSERYAGLFRKDTLTISVFLGFSDSDIPDLVLDRPIKRALVAQLTGTCPPGLLACGFASAPGAEDTPAVLTRKLPFNSQKKTIVVKIFDSSVSESSRECAGPLRGRQQAKSGATTGEYLKALERGDIVLYMGHSRYGTGPGFSPLSFVSPAALGTYIRRPLLPRIRTALKDRSGPPAVIGFLSCDSEKFYAALAHSASPGSALLLSSDNSTHLNNACTLLGFIDSVLGMRCSGDFIRSLNKDGANRTFSLYGFFAGSPHPQYRRHTPVVFILAALLLIPFLILLAPARFAGWCELPPGTPKGPLSGFVFLAASFLPGLLAARLLNSGGSFALPLVLSVSGCLALAFSIFRKRIPAGSLAPCAAGALPPLLLAAAAYFCMTFLPEPSAGNAAYSLLQTLRLSLTFALLLPFCMFSGDILLRTRPDNGAKGFIFSAALTLALYFTLALGLDRAGTRVSFSLVSVSILALYLHSVSFLLRSRGRNMTGAAFFQALAMALIFTEGMQIFLYN